MSKMINSNDLARRKEILDAALYCFLHFGYSKTSMDDVAKKANLSRPLIYLKYKSKEDLLIGLFDHIMGGLIEDAQNALDKRASKKENAFKVFEILILRPWDKISGRPMSQEFFGTCEHFDSKSAQKYEKQKLRLITDILENKNQAEVLVLAVDGLMSDLPTTKILKKRLELLIENFVN